MKTGVAGLNGVFTAKPRVGLDAILSASQVPWVDVILVVEAKHLPRDLGLDPKVWDVVHEVHEGDGKAGVAAAVRRSTSRVEAVYWRLGLRKNRYTLDRWILTVRVRHRRPSGKWARHCRRYRVTHVVPKVGWIYWPAQMARTVVGRWTVLYADFNKLNRAVKPVVARARGRAARLVMRHIVGLAIAPGVAAKGRVKTWRTHGLDHDIVAAEIGRGRRPNTRRKP